MASNYKAITNQPGWLSDYTSSGIPQSTANLYETSPLLFRAVRLRADALSGVPVKILQGENEVDWPYPESLPALIWKAEASLLLTGGGYWEKVSNRGRIIKDVQYRNPFDMSVEYKSGELHFRQNSSGATWVNDLKKGLYEIVYFTDFDPKQDILPGIGAAEVARIDSRLLTALSMFPEKYFEGGAMPVTLLGIDATDAGEIRRVEEWFRRAATSVKNAFRVLGIRAGSIKPEKLTPDLNTLVMPELYATAKKNIAVAFGIPESMLDTTASNFATAKEARLGFYEDVIKPRARMFEGVINQQLFGREGLTIEFDFERMQIFQEDEADRSGVLRDLSAANVPLELALDLAGYELTDEQKLFLVEGKPEQENQDREQVLVTPVMQDAIGDELRRWQRMAEKRVKELKPIRDFNSDIIPAALNGAIAGQLEGAKSVEDVRHIFHSAIEWSEYP